MSTVENENLYRDDQKLIQRCLSGDESAFEELVLAYQNMVFNVAYRFLSNAGEAEELAQEVFMRIYRHLENFRGASSLKTWIYRITTNLALNKIKFNKRRKIHKSVSLDQEIRPDSPTLGDTIADNRPGPDKRTMGGEIQEQLQIALDQLSKDQKAVVILRDIEGLTYEEISDALEVNIGTVKSRLARGRSNLQTLLKDLI